MIDPFVVKLCAWQLVCDIGQCGRWHLLDTSGCCPTNTIFPWDMVREASSFFYECGPCLNDLLAASKLYLSGGSLALPWTCFRSWSKSMVQNTTCYGDCYTCSMDKSCTACPWACRLNSKAWMTVPERWLLFLKHSCHFFIILNQKYGVFCFTCWQPQAAPSTTVYKYHLISHPKPEEICNPH